jgi:prepilin-type N-terminal cleavage/methylation domain-containing protein/prepilin-type processing-associated H-X9-DG protein
MNRNRHPAFTLIELLVVIAILAILAALLFPVFAGVREKARQATCLSNEKQLAAAVLMYVQDHDDTFPFVLNWSANCTVRWGANTGDKGKHPWVPGFTGQEPQFQLATLVAPYVRSTDLWYCPTVGPDYVWQAMVNDGGWKKGATMRDQRTTYTYNYLAGRFVGADWRPEILIGGKSAAILHDASRWPMLVDAPGGAHSGGMNVAYGDGHAKYEHPDQSDSRNWLGDHAGDGVIPGQ